MEQQLTKITFKERVREKNRQLLGFRRFLRFETPGDEIREYLGVDVFTVREWLQEQFLDRMNWENYGSVWVVDHIVPLRMFNIFDENDLKLCWHYKNLMPLFKEDNLKKEGNVFLSYTLLMKLKDKDYFYQRLFERIEPEFIWMNNYINNYQKRWLVK